MSWQERVERIIYKDCEWVRWQDYQPGDTMMLAVDFDSLSDKEKDELTKTHWEQLEENENEDEEEIDHSEEKYDEWCYMQELEADRICAYPERYGLI